MQLIESTKYQYKSLFHEKNGFYMRTGIMKNGKDTGVDPFMAEFPELLDVGIMGNCIHGKSGLCQKAGVDCYQSGSEVYENHMSLEDFKRIVSECQGRTYQFALGGRGDPDQHPYFTEILESCHNCHIVPNFTTSGFGITEEIANICRQYCGAVAVSWYGSDYTYRAIDLLLQANVKTNIHYILSRNTLQEAIRLLEWNGFPDGINAVIFLLYKPIGLGKVDFILTETTPYLKYFFELIDKKSFKFKIGFDSCMVPGLIRYSKNIDFISIDTCEGGRWSAYITPDLVMLPCSFDNQQRKWGVSLRTHTMEEAWNSVEFGNFRGILKHSCPICEKKAICMGGCPICPDIVLCGNHSQIAT